MKSFEGVFTALITPFKNGSVDKTSLKQLVHQQMSAGIEGLVVNGTTAESPTLTAKDREQIWELIRYESGGKIPLLFGTGSNSTAQTVELSQVAERMGADGVLVVVPYYNKPPQRGLFAHFSAVAEAVKIPLVLYNVPGRTITSLEAKTIQKLSQIQNIVGIKEATGDIGFGKEVLQLVPKEFLVSSGDDGTFLELMLEGGRGVISVLSHVLPEQTVRLSKRAIQAKDRGVLQEFKKYEKLTQMLFQEPNPIPVKAALHLMGVIASDELRLPLVSCSPELKTQIKSELQKLEVIP